jgi:hypothetical protein
MQLVNNPTAGPISHHRAAHNVCEILSQYVGYGIFGTFDVNPSARELAEKRVNTHSRKVVVSVENADLRNGSGLSVKVKVLCNRRPRRKPRGARLVFIGNHENMNINP